jgi:ribosomal protein S18 acetylase RimI-like enzyme
MAASDLDCVVAWHLEAFPSGFYAQLGARFMRAWFASHIAAPASVSLVACDGDGAVVGYLLGTLDDADYRARSAGDSARLLARGAAAFIARPGLWGEFARVRARPYAAFAARRLLGHRAPMRPGAGQGNGELVYICVEPEHRRRGAGAALLEAYTGEAIRTGTARLHLVTELDNKGAQRFYSQHGWHVMADPAHALDGRTLVRMERHLRTQAACVG